mmetsp:Transcript_123402/g.360326  ORF Transcript_123402/g.360326 Transcript_123402/m.360326 type:complete len:246 (-) Transcript_123402:101-838(-)
MAPMSPQLLPWRCRRRALALAATLASASLLVLRVTTRPAGAWGFVGVRGQPLTCHRPAPRLCPPAAGRGAAAGEAGGSTSQAPASFHAWLMGFAQLCMAYLLGIVATELIVFDCGPPRAAYWFYTASLPSLVAWPQALRIALPVAGIAVSLLYGMGTGLRKRAQKQGQGRLRWSLAAAGLLSVPGLASLGFALAGASAFCTAWSSPFGLNRARAVESLLKVRAWHVVMFVTLLLCMFALRRAQQT